MAAIEIPLLVVNHQIRAEALPLAYLRRSLIFCSATCLLAAHRELSVRRLKAVARLRMLKIVPRILVSRTFEKLTGIATMVDFLIGKKVDRSVRLGDASVRFNGEAWATVDVVYNVETAFVSR